MEQVTELVSKEAVHQLKEVHAELKSISDLSDEGIRLKCLELASGNYVTDVASMVDASFILKDAKSFYNWVKGI